MLGRYLFRGKRIDNGEWVYGGLCEIPPPLQCIGKPPPSKVCIFCEHPNHMSDWGMPREMCLIDVDPDTIGQCTGLKDRNDKLIYEGDIVRIDGDNAGVWVIQDVGGGFCAMQGEKTFAWYRYAKVDHTKFDLVIIGNIHDNPDLGGKVGANE